MPKYIVIHGSLKVAAGEFVRVGQPVELSEEEVASIDPEGKQLVSEKAYAALKAQADAQEKLEVELKEKAAGLKAVAPKVLAAIRAEKKAAAESSAAAKKAAAEKKGA